MTRQTEQLLLDAVHDVSAHVEKGASPTDAVIKAAQHFQLGRNMIPLVVQAYNVGRTTWQQSQQDAGILGKQAEFPIARLEDVLAGVFPSSPPTPAQEKRSSAVSDDYSRPPRVTPSDQALLQKAAEAIDIRLPAELRAPEREVPVSRKVAQVFAAVNREKKAVEQAEREYRISKEHYLASMGKIRDYFAKESAMFRLPFAEVEHNAVLLFGEPARHALEYAYTTGRLKEARASGPIRYLARARPDEAPYSLIKAAIDRACDLLACRRVLAQTKQAAEDHNAETLRPFSQPPEVGTPSRLSGGLDTGFSAPAKSAGLFSNMAMMGAGSYARGKGMVAVRDDPAQAAEAELNSPEHLGQLREIETRAMLQDLLRNDEVISGYDPDEVLDAYNEIAQLSPRVSEQPAIIRPLLRKRLTQGSMEPFEAQEMTNMEKTLRQTSNTPDFRVAPPSGGGGSSSGGGSGVPFSPTLLQAPMMVYALPFT